jgi:DNA polymerase-4
LRDSATILHVDMDCFFAAVEVLRDPSLAGKPVIVGGAGLRGVVASCSYEARAYGIHSAMPSSRARRLCPHAVFVPGHYDVYADYSKHINDVFRSYTPLVEGISLDEAFLDVSGAQRLFGPAPEIAAQIRHRIFEEHGLWASVGVASCKLIAKLASEAAKPTASLKGPVPGKGVVVVDVGDELAFLHPLPVGALWGVGPATRERLRRFGVATVGDLAHVPLDTLVTALGKGVGQHLHGLAWAEDDRPVVPEGKAKSISHEETYAHDIADRERLHREIVRMGDAVASRLRESGLAGRTVSIKVRFHDFATITRSHTVGGGIDNGPEIVRIASALIDAVDVSAGVRLLGVGVSNLVEGIEAQLTFDDLIAQQPGGPTPTWDEATKAVDEVRRRFGERALGPAVLADGAGVQVKRRGEQQWGPSGPAAGE